MFFYRGEQHPPHYDTFAEFQYAYHYGDIYVPHIKQEEPLKAECQHFLDCIRSEATPLTDGHRGLELVRILEAASRSLKANGAPIDLSRPHNGNHSVHDLPASQGQASPVGRARKKSLAPDASETCSRS
jgi:hypothetical protein